MKTQVIRAILVLIAFISLPSIADDNKKKVIVTTKTQEQQSALTPWAALQKLKNGNDRFVTSSMRQRDLGAQVASSKKQFPFAVILSCMDSRGSAEFLFDQGIGDIFSERLAGNVVNTDVLAGMEFGTKLTGAKLIVVLGHTSCGAVKGACENAKLGNLTLLLEKIKPAVMKVNHEGKGKKCDSDKVINEIAKLNVLNAIEQIKKESPVVMALLKEGKVGIVGGMHDIATGKVTFFDDLRTLPGAPLPKL